MVRQIYQNLNPIKPTQGNKEDLERRRLEKEQQTKTQASVFANRRSEQIQFDKEQAKKQIREQQAIQKQRQTTFKQPPVKRVQQEIKPLAKQPTKQPVARPQVQSYHVTPSRRGNELRAIRDKQAREKKALEQQREQGLSKAGRVGEQRLKIERKKKDLEDSRRQAKKTLDDTVAAFKREQAGINASSSDFKALDKYSQLSGFAKKKFGEQFRSSIQRAEKHRKTSAKFQEERDRLLSPALFSDQAEYIAEMEKQLEKSKASIPQQDKDQFNEIVKDYERRGETQEKAHSKAWRDYDRRAPIDQFDPVRYKTGFGESVAINTNRALVASGGDPRSALREIEEQRAIIKEDAKKFDPYLRAKEKTKAQASKQSAEVIKASNEEIRAYLQSQGLSTAYNGNFDALPTNAKQAVLKLVDAKEKSLSKIKEFKSEGLSEIVYQEEKNEHEREIAELEILEKEQIKHEQEQARLEDPAYRHKVEKEKEKYAEIARIRETQSVGATTAEAIWKQQQKFDGKEPTKKQIGKEFTAMLDDAKIPQGQELAHAVRLNNGNVDDAMKLLESRGVPNAKEQYSNFLRSKGWEEADIQAKMGNDNITDLTREVMESWNKGESPDATTLQLLRNKLEVQAISGKKHAKDLLERIDLKTENPNLTKDQLDILIKGADKTDKPLTTSQLEAEFLGGERSVEDFQEYLERREALRGGTSIEKMGFKDFEADYLQKIATGTDTPEDKARYSEMRAIVKGEKKSTGGSSVRVKNVKQLRDELHLKIVNGLDTPEDHEKLSKIERIISPQNKAEQELTIDQRMANITQDQADYFQRITAALGGVGAGMSDNDILDRKNSFLRQIKAGVPIEEIYEKALGFIVHDDPEKKAYQNVISTALTGVAKSSQITAISIAIGKGNFDEAINKSERIAMKDIKADFKDVGRFNSGIDKGEEIIEFINNNKILSKYTGSWDAIVTTLGVKTGDEQYEEVMTLQGKIRELMATYRNEISGAAVTETESEFLKPFIPDINDSPKQIITKLNVFSDGILNKLNNTRKLAGLPTVTRDTRNDMKAVYADLATQEQVRLANQATYKKEMGGLAGTKQGVVNGLPETANLGGLSSAMESSEGIAAFGNNPTDKGGPSYGKYQIASKMGSMSNFISLAGRVNPEIAKKLISVGGEETAVENPAKFLKVWKQIAQESPVEFEELQDQFAKKLYYDVSDKHVQRLTGLNISTRSNALQQLLLSSAIHHGQHFVKTLDRGTPAIFFHALKDEQGKIDKEKISKMTDKEIIEKVQGMRRKWTAGSTDKDKLALENRVDRESRLVLQMLERDASAGYKAPYIEQERQQKQAEWDQAVANATPEELIQLGLSPETNSKKSFFAPLKKATQNLIKQSPFAFNKTTPNKDL